MENINDTILVDMTKVENLLRNKMIELQLKTNSLDETQRELAQARQSLYETERMVEEERRANALMQAQLDISMAVARRWEEEKTLKRCQQIQSVMYTETIIRERDSLLQQTKNLQLENMMLKQKINEVESINADREIIDGILLELKNKVSLMTKTANREIETLQKELEDLQNSVEAANKLNGRLQVAGMCARAIQYKYEMKIKELEDKLDSMTQF